MRTSVMSRFHVHNGDHRREDDEQRAQGQNADGEACDDDESVKEHGAFSKAKGQA